jgi:pSer/pThr/pTyr-binding forkhead associated (FHA) protein
VTSEVTHVDVEVTRQGQLIASGRYKLPLILGRSDKATIQLGVDPLDRFISRIHARVEMVGGRLVVLDLSTNGTLHDGQIMGNREIVALKSNDYFQIRDYLIRISQN